MTWFRALAAAGLSVLLPGAGHALIRDWLRAMLFTGTYIAAVVVLLSTEQLSAASSFSEAMQAMEGMSMQSQFVLGFIVLFAAIDATFRALGFPPGSRNESSDGPSCPSCGKELDEDLTFCHWCTTRLEPAGADDGDELDDEPSGS